jgi:hypothetical protein
MKLRMVCVVVGFLSLALSLVPPTVAQTPTETASALPRLVRFSGPVKDLNGTALTGVVGITFALYSEQTGGAALWLETQNVTADSNGHYTALLGSTQPGGLPADLFTSEQARWVGVQISGQAEQPRVLLVSAPYALKAGDAETVGGLPASAFVLAAPPSTLSSNSGSATAAGAASSSAPGASPLTGTLTGAGTTDFLPLWTSSSNIGNSVLFQSGTGSTAKVGINTTTPGATLDVKGGTNIEGLLDLPATGTATASGGKISQAQNFVASSYNSGTAAAVSQTFQWRAEPAGNNTATPSGTLSLLFGSGTSSPAETGLKLSNKGLFTFATGQTFPGTGTLTGVTTASGSGLTGGGTGGTLNLGLKTCGANQVLQYLSGAWTCSNAGTGTVTSVASGTGLTGGPITGSGTLSLASHACASGSALSALPFTCSPFATLGANTFTGNQTVNGNLTVLNNSNYQPFLVQSSSGFGTWLELSNTSAGGQTWNILSAASGNAEGAGNLGITNLQGGTIWLEGPVNAQGNLNVNNNGTVQIGTTSTGGMLNAVASSSSLVGVSATGYSVPSGSGLQGGPAVVAQGGTDDPSASGFAFGGDGVRATGGTDLSGGIGGEGGTGVYGTGGYSNNYIGGTGVFGAGGVGNFFYGDGVGGNTEVGAGYAGNFTGDVNVSGSISAGTKDFKIDHPLDPANKYLVHASVESSEMMNIYTGNITTDGQGQATVQLPEWFEVLNTDFRYQLTVIGQFAQAIIGRKIENNRFEIRTSAPNVEVSWQVTGVRQDAYAKAHPLVVEQEKDARLRGFYIHPELYGAPPEKQIEWARQPQMMKKMQEARAKQLAVAQKQIVPRN